MSRSRFVRAMCSAVLLLVLAGGARAAEDAASATQLQSFGAEYGSGFRQYFLGRTLMYPWGWRRMRLGLGLDVISLAGPFEFSVRPVGGDARLEQEYPFSVLSPRVSLLVWAWKTLPWSLGAGGRMHGGIELYDGFNWLTFHKYGIDSAHVSCTDFGVAVHTGFMLTLKVGRVFGTMSGGDYTSPSWDTVRVAGYRERKDYVTVGFSFGGIFLPTDHRDVEVGTVAVPKREAAVVDFRGVRTNDASEDLRWEGLALLAEGRLRRGRRSLKRACGLGLIEACEDLRAWDRKDKR